MEEKPKEISKATVRRVAKEALAGLSPDYDIVLQKDALLAVTDSARIFIHYLSAVANDVRKESSRRAINSEDVMRALEEMEFHDFIEPLKNSLCEFKQKYARKAPEESESSDQKKRKSLGETSKKNEKAKVGKMAATTAIENDGD